jgi:hypothetical protein
LIVRQSDFGDWDEALRVVGVQEATEGSNRAQSWAVSYLLAVTLGSCR